MAVKMAVKRSKTPTKGSKMAVKSWKSPEINVKQLQTDANWLSVDENV